MTPNTDKIRPLRDNVLVKLEGSWDDYSGPLVLPDAIDPEKRDVRFARVLAVGPGDHGENEYEPHDPKYERCRKRGRRIPVPLELGQRVLIDQIATHGWWPCVGEDLYLIPWRQMLGIVEEP